MTLFKSKGKRYGIPVALLLIVAALLSKGCPYGAVPGGVPPPPHPWYERPAITTDERGGAIVFYALQEEDLGRRGYWCRRRRFYVQRVDKEGNFLWGEGVLVGKGYGRGPYGLEIVSDQAEGAIVVWRTIERRAPEARFTLHVARLSPQGEIFWQRDLQRIPLPSLPERRHLLAWSDGSQGVIIGWGLGVQRIDSEGRFLWGENGITLFHHDGVVTEKGGGILVWGAGDGTILAQKISPGGDILWFEEGVQVGRGVGPQVTLDRLGGAIITWTKLNDTEDDSVPTWEIVAQRIDTQGNRLWQEGGVPVFIAEMPPGPHRHRLWVDIISSGGGEAIIAYLAWGRYRGFYVQKIDSDGNLGWQERGVRVYGDRADVWCIAGDNFDGGILAWGRLAGHGRSLLQAHRVDAEGKLLWPEQVSVTTASARRFSMAADGEGGVLVAWVVHEFGPLQPYIQRINDEGERMWGDEGILLKP